MSTATLTLALPDALYQRLERAAAATKQSLQDVALRALRLGSPPEWDDAPPEFQVELAALEKLDDDALRSIATARRTVDADRRDELLSTNSARPLTAEERVELDRLRLEEDLFVLKKAHAAALLQWRGQPASPP